MSDSPDSKRKAIMGGVAAVLLIAAAVVFFMSRGEPQPDAATKAAIERSKELEASTANQPATPDLPIESRSQRGAVGGK